MAFSLFFLFLSLLSLSTTTTTAGTPTTTATLDVATTVQKTLDLLNPNFLQQQSDKSQKTSSESRPKTTSSSLSFTVHPRSSIHKLHHNDYESLTRARLARDSHRVNSVITNMDISISGTNRSEMKPVVESNSMYKVEDLTTPVTSGISQGSGEYFARCQALETSACRSTGCLYQVSYGDGSFTVGDFVTETVSFGNSGSVPSVAIGCGHDNEGLFVGSAGLLALGGGPLSLPSQIKATSFSYCLVDRDSDKSSTLEFNSAPPAGSVTAPLLRNPKVKTYLYVGLTGISVGGRPLSIPPSIFAVDDSGRGGAIVDSGTAVTRLQSQAYNSLRDAFTQQARNLKPTDGFSLFDTCYDFSSLTRVAVPTVAFNFAGGKTLSLRPENYLIPVDSNGKFCLAFAPTDSPLSIIGNVQQQGTRVGYDISKSVVSFSPGNC
ncbi:putative nepenthesin [Helianthus debilis subsp. tardiflorus]